MNKITIAGVVITCLAALVPRLCAAADFRVECTSGCERTLPSAEQSPNLLLLDDAQTEIELTWTIAVSPDPKERLDLHAGNPEMRDKLTELGPLTFTQAAGGWTAKHRFAVADLGRGTFIAAMVRRRDGTQSIADWRIFRLLRLSEVGKRDEGAPITDNLSVALVPELMQVTSGPRELPPSSGGNERVWWPIPESYSGVDVDIDGTSTGVPGLTITHSPPWASQGADWRQSVLEHLPKVVGHFVSFDDLQFNQSGDEKTTLDGVGTVEIRHYYSAITLFTNATFTVYSAKDLGLSGNKRYFAHEASANFKQRAHPFLWSSYSRHEYSADSQLLGLIQKGMQKDGSIPGLSQVQQDDGDGGSVVYRVGFLARVAPWSVPNATQAFKPGFVHVDIVAVRTGFGDIETRGTTDNSPALCKLIKCSDATKLDLSHPPRGYEVAAPTAITGSQSGTLVMLQGKPLRANRDSEGIDFPTRARFAIAAQLRAGALIRKSGFFNTNVEDIAPINSYAQYVVKYTVAMIPQTVMVASDESILPKASEFNTSTVDVPQKNLWEKLKELLGGPGLTLIVIVLVVVLAFLFPPVARLFSAIVGLLADVVNRIRNGVKKPP